MSLIARGWGRSPVGRCGGRCGGLALLLGLGCGGPPEGQPKGEPIPVFDSGEPEAEAPCPDGEGLSWDGFGWGFFLTYCNACHSAGASERYGAPVGVDFDRREDVVRQVGRVRARVLEEGTMPLGGGVPPEALDQLEAYLCLIDGGG